MVSRATSCRSTSVGWGSSSTGGRRRVVQALIFTACYSRHCFVWLTFRQTTEAVIDGFEAAWAFFGGIFATVIPDNLSAVVDDADPLAAAVEPGVRRVRPSQRVPGRPGTGAPPAGQAASGAHGAVRAQLVLRRRDVHRSRRRPTTRRAVVPGAGRATDPRHHPAPPARGVRDRGTATAGAAAGRALRRADLRHGEGASRSSRRSGQGALLGAGQPHRDRVEVRADRALVRIFQRGQLVKVHPRQAPGGRSTDPADLPADKTVYAMRDLDRLRRMAAGHGDAIGVYAAALLDIPLPWTKMRQVYALLGPGQEVGCRAGQHGLRQRPGRRSDQRRADRADARTRHRDRRRSSRRCPAPWSPAASPATPTTSPSPPTPHRPPDVAAGDVERHSGAAR